MQGAVFFDLDGTLLDRRLSFRRFAAGQQERYAVEMPYVQPAAWVERSIVLDDNGFRSREELYAALADQFSLSQSLGDELLRDFRDRFGSECVPFEGSVATLAGLRSQGVRLGLITNGTVAMQQSKVDALGIAPYFDAILISESEGVRKPDVQIFQRATLRLGVHPAESVHVGDHPDADVRGAKSSGMRAIWIRDEHWGEPAEADGAVYRIDQVPAVLTQWAFGG